MTQYRHAPEITDEVITDAFANYNFGRTDYREFLGYSVLKKVCGWHCGHTITSIMVDLKLITPKHFKLTKLGQMFLSDSYDDPLRTTPASAVVPEGWKLVPVEPTGAMYAAGDEQLTTKQVWDAMLAAALAPGGDDV
ncbi:hypothetical protein Q3V30_12195 [Erwinia pyri]|uniref:Uncharacterized protein n=1 Tax=Erwinia pyri TaxID=3062598 RepID=A0AA50DJA8_9GAMM|nr:hypothetical protein [Erwinia sp. DE2]WLS77251.1 hypothetical protein Q3V30_12195 [Erwinia sp. DE2]